MAAQGNALGSGVVLKTAALKGRNIGHFEMPQSLANVLVHIVFSTKNHSPFLSPAIRNELFPYIATVCTGCKSHAHKIGGVEDHIHVVCSLSRTITIAALIEEIKTNSSKWIKTKGREFQRFGWQNGYGAFSIGQSQLDSVKRYIESQPEHHKKMTFQEEFREFLRRYQIEHDERYVWD
jgi:REP element-mobilizing transposase RayT